MGAILIHKQQLLVLFGNKDALNVVVTLNVPIPPPHSFFPVFLPTMQRGRRLVQITASTMSSLRERSSGLAEWGRGRGSHTLALGEV